MGDSHMKYEDGRYGGGMRRNDRTHTIEQILSAVHRERERG